MHTHTHPHTYPHPDAVIVLFPSCLSALIPPDHDMPLDQMLLWQHTHREEKNIIRHYKTSGLIHNWMDKRLWISKSSSDGRGSWWVGQGNNEAKTLETLELSLPCRLLLLLLLCISCGPSKKDWMSLIRWAQAHPYVDKMKSGKRNRRAANGCVANKILLPLRKDRDLVGEISCTWKNNLSC